MPIYKKVYEPDLQTDRAKNVREEVLYITDANSGRQGYYCLGCNKQMEAVIQKKNPNYRSFFRHVAVDVAKGETPCAFSNREYRENLATDILQRLKSIKVPNLYKYPPKGIDGVPVLLEKAKFITAHTVRSQISFYEDVDGTLKYGNNTEVKERYNLMIPDVVFFDIYDKPILFIELVITHEINDEKRSKLRRLGVDTVSIIIPKSSDQEIEDNFKTTKRVKWEYNGIEADTKYIRVSAGASEGILEFDEQQRRIFEESYTCRKIRIENTIRTIRKCLEGEHYRRPKFLFEQEISRIEKATEKERQELEYMEKREEDKVYEGLKSQFETIAGDAAGERERGGDLKGQHENLEGRYTSKRRELENSASQLQEDIRELTGFRDPERELPQRTRSISGDIERERKLVEPIREGIKRELENRMGINDTVEQRFRELKNGEQGNFTRETVSIKLEEARVDRDIEAWPQRLRENRIEVERKSEDKLSQSKARLREEHRKRREYLESEINGFEDYARREKAEIERRVIQEFRREIKIDTPELPRGLRTILEARTVVSLYADAKRENERYTRAYEVFRKGAWEKGENN